MGNITILKVLFDINYSGTLISRYDNIDILPNPNENVLSKKDKIQLALGGSGNLYLYVMKCLVFLTLEHFLTSLVDVNIPTLKMFC